MFSRRYNEENDAVVDSTVDSTTSGGGGYFTVPSPPPHPAQANEAAHEGDNTEDEEEGADTESIPGKDQPMRPLMRETIWRMRRRERIQRAFQVRTSPGQ
jgi:hypothetical protein